jgi:hypothetical protein
MIKGIEINATRLERRRFRDLSCGSLIGIRGAFWIGAFDSRCMLVILVFTL